MTVSIDTNFCVSPATPSQALAGTTARGEIFDPDCGAKAQFNSGVVHANR